MTEIPEHLLKRSRERRAALGGDATPPPDAGDNATGDAPAAPPAVASSSSTPAAASPPTPERAAPAGPPPPRPDPPYVAAAKRRGKIPFWAMTALAILPLWAFMYVRSLTPTERAAAGPTGDGAEVYGSCSSCHGAAGGGGSGRALNEGEVLLTFPNIEDQLNFVYNGSDAYDLAGVDVIGDPAREGGPHEVYAFNGAAMPRWSGSLTEAEIVAVVCHERYELSGADPTSEEWSDEYETWCGPDSEVYTRLQDGVLTFDSPELKVGTEPRPALQAGQGAPDPGEEPAEGG